MEVVEAAGVGPASRAESELPQPSGTGGTCDVLPSEDKSERCLQCCHSARETDANLTRLIAAWLDLPSAVRRSLADLAAGCARPQSGRAASGHTGVSRGTHAIAAGTVGNPHGGGVEGCSIVSLTTPKWP